VGPPAKVITSDLPIRRFVRKIQQPVTKGVNGSELLVFGALISVVAIDGVPGHFVK
jgi:hypothetical protein